MPDTNTGSQSQPQNSVTSGSSAVTTDETSAANTSGAAATGSGPTVKDTNPDLKAIRLNGRKEERRRVANILKEYGIEVNGPNLEEVLRSTLSSIKPGVKTQVKSGKEEKPEEELDNRYRQQLTDRDSKITGLSERVKDLAIEKEIALSVAGVSFANERASRDAITAFRHAYRFEIDEDTLAVRVLDMKGDPVTNSNYQDASVEEAFAQFLQERPHFRKAEAAPGQNVQSQKGTALNQTFNDLVRQAAGVQAH